LARWEGGRFVRTFPPSGDGTPPVRFRALPRGTRRPDRENEARRHGSNGVNRPSRHGRPAMVRPRQPHEARVLVLLKTEDVGCRHRLRHASRSARPSHDGQGGLGTRDSTTSLTRTSTARAAKGVWYVRDLSSAGRARDEFRAAGKARGMRHDDQTLRWPRGRPNPAFPGRRLGMAGQSWNRRRAGSREPSPRVPRGDGVRHATMGVRARTGSVKAPQGETNTILHGGSAFGWVERLTGMHRAERSREVGKR
jgi:hypothetical protein